MTVFRSAITDDYESVQIIQNQVYEKHVKFEPAFFRVVDKSIDKGFFEKEITEGHVFVFEDNSILIGYAFVHYIEPRNHPLIKEQKSLFIDDIGIHDEFKRMGYGSKLFNELEQFGKKQNCTSIELSVWDFNAEAQEFYTKMEMSAIMTRMKKAIK